jgi:hypothetical protein
MATSATEQEAGGGTALQQRPHSLGEPKKPGNQEKILRISAVFSSRDIVMSNGPGDNGNQVFCNGSLVTGFKATKIVTGNGKFPPQVVTRLARTQMT